MKIPQKVSTPQNQRVMELHKEIYNEFLDAEALALTVSTKYQELPNNKVMINFGQGISLEPLEKDRLKTCMRKVYGEDVFITVKAHSNDNKTISKNKVVDDKTKYAQDAASKPIWAEVKGCLLDLIEPARFHAWFSHPSLTITEEKKGNQKIVSLTSDAFLISYINNNFQSGLQDAADKLRVTIKLYDINLYGKVTTNPYVYSHK